MTTLTISASGIPDIKPTYGRFPVSSYNSNVSWPSEVSLDVSLGAYTLSSQIIPTTVDYISTRSPQQFATVAGHTSGNALSDSYSPNWSTAVNTTTIDGKTCLDLDTTHAIGMSGTAPVFGQYYTMFAGWYPRVTDTGWRTFWRGDNDHNIIVNNGAKDLGMYSNRNGAFRDTGYNISIAWQTIIVVGSGDSSTASTGTQSYYIDGQLVGTTDRVASGTNASTFGYSGQAPGYFTEFGFCNQAFSATEVQELHESLSLGLAGISGSVGWTDNFIYTNTQPSSYTAPDLSFYDRQRVQVSSENTITHPPKHFRKTITSINNTVPYNLAELRELDGTRRQYKIARAIQSDVSGSGDGGGSSGTSEIQTWY